MGRISDQPARFVPLFPVTRGWGSTANNVIRRGGAFDRDPDESSWHSCNIHPKYVSLCLDRDDLTLPVMTSWWIVEASDGGGHPAVVPIKV
jgi:hypothetical protein